MKSHTTREFREAYSTLQPPLRELARKAYKLFRANPNHPSLNFKKIDAAQGIYSARISIGYRALARVDGDDVTWFWIGSHRVYDRKI